MTSPFALRCTENFYIPQTAIEDVNGFFRLKSYGNGPDPVREIEPSNCPVRNHVASACLSVREALLSYLNNGIPPINNDWPSVFTFENLAGKSSVTSGWVELFFRNNAEVYPGFDLNLHNVCDIFSSCKNIEHAFQIVKSDGRLFIVDLSIRQFINGSLRLKDEEAVVIDSLLKNGFVEVGDGVLDIYYSFFDSYSRHKERWKGSFNNYREWYLYDSKIPKTCLEALCCS